MVVSRSGFSGRFRGPSMYLFTLRSPSFHCVDCQGVAPAGCGFRSVPGAWQCVVCGSPGVNQASVASCVWFTLRGRASMLLFEWRMRNLSRYRIVRWLRG